MAKKKPHKSETSALLTPYNLWENNDNDVWLASSLKFYRNIHKFKFPGMLTIDQRKQILSLIEKECMSLDCFKEMTFLPAENVDPADKELIFEHFLAMESLHQAYSGEGFIIGGKEQFLSIINIRNHLQLQLLDYTGELENTLNRLIKIESRLCETINFAFSPRFGFLTADPMKCGTALSVYAFLQIPALIGSGAHTSLLKTFREEDSVDVMGLKGDPKEFEGNIVILHNHYTLGINEETIVSLIRSCATKLIIEEKAKRNQMKSDDGADFKDKVSRAYGLLTHTYQIETLETMEAISYLKLGIDLGWLEGLTLADANALNFSCRRAHLMALSGETDPKKLPQRRAEFIRKSLKKAKLKI